MKPYYDEDGIQIFHCDCREVQCSADAFCTDPPWGLNGSSGTIGAARRKSVYVSDFSDTLDYVQQVCVPTIRRLINDVGRGCVTPGTRHAWEYPKPQDCGALLHPASNGLGPWGHAGWQPVLFYGRDPRLGQTISRMVFESNEVQARSSHPCPKPLVATKWLVSRVSEPEDTILDPFMGSGTTLIAAKDLGRKAIGIEIEERYCEIAAIRLAQGVFDWTGEKAVAV